MTQSNSKAKLKIIPSKGEGTACAAQPALSTSGNNTNLKADKFRGRAAVVTLGCAKNQVDSEVMLGVLKQSGYELVSDVERADVAIVNTCGFLESAVKESIDCILDISDLKKTGQLRKLIVGGCAVSRYRADLVKALPEVDAFITLDELLDIGKVADQSSELAGIFSQAGRPYFLYDENMPRELSGQQHSAYVKVAEGCNRPCTFCIIPTIRGAMRSRPVASVVNEVRMLASKGVREVNLVAQDLTSYGSDRASSERLADLLQALDSASLDSAQAVDWIRLLYAYPIGIDQRLLETIVSLKSVCNYLDLPLQHASEAVLKPMQRPLGRYSPIRVIDFIKQTAPQIKMRTTFIVGFPGETEADVEQLANFVRSGAFASVGVFTYSAEDGTPAAKIANQLSEQEKKARQAYIMNCQKEVVAKQLPDYVGQEIEVLVDGLHEESDLLIQGRTYFQAPEVDGVVIINDLAQDLELIPGAICRLEVTEVAGYDLVGRGLSLVKPSRPSYPDSSQTHFSNNESSEAAL